MAGGLSRTGTGTGIPQGPAAALSVVSPPHPSSQPGGELAEPWGCCASRASRCASKAAAAGDMAAGAMLSPSGQMGFPLPSPPPPPLPPRHDRHTDTQTDGRGLAGCGHMRVQVCVRQGGLAPGWGRLGKGAYPRAHVCAACTRPHWRKGVHPCACVCARVCVLRVGICRCGHMRCACGCAKCAYVCLCAPYVCIVGQARVCTCACLCARTRRMCAFRHVRVRAHTCARLLCAQIWVVSLPGFVPVPPQGPALGCCHVPVSSPSPCPMQVLQAGRGKAATPGSCPHAAGAPVGAAAVPPMAELVTLRRAHLRGPILR